MRASTISDSVTVQASSTLIRNLLREPLLHFLLLGGALFALFAQVGGDSGNETVHRIVIKQADVERLRTLWQRRWMRPPTPNELEGLIEGHIREEILYREALALGLERDDTIVRRRMAQKMEFLFADLAVPSPPNDEELERFLDEHPDRFTVPARLSFTQIYVNPDRRGPGAVADAEQLLLALRDRGDDIDPAAFGDPTLIEPYHERASPREIARLFGARFADAVTPLATGRWHGPIESGYGMHLVYVRAHEPERLPPLDEVRERVRTELMSERQREANEAFYEELRKRYEVVVETGSGEGPGVAMAKPAS